MAHMASFRLPPLLLCILGSACSTSVVMQSHWSTWSWYGAEPDSEARTLSVDCPADVKTVRATLSTNATAGEIAFLLVDPAGIERHRETVRGGNREAVLTWPGSEGAWRLEVTPKDFSGYYSVELCAHDKPIQVEVRMAVDQK
jgi:hypothetical protein